MQQTPEHLYSAEKTINMSTNLRSDHNDSHLTIGVPASKEMDAIHASNHNVRSPGGPKKKSYKEGWIRWLTLFFACCFLMGSYFCYDNPGPIEKTMEKDLDISQTQFSLLYSVYSYPNIVLPIFGGIFLDMIGLR